jgi:hypothetical protein
MPRYWGILFISLANKGLKNNQFITSPKYQYNPKYYDAQK